MKKIPLFSKPLYKAPFCYVLIVLAGIIVYANSLNVPFHFDGYEYIVSNPFTKHVSHLFQNWNEYPRKFLVYLSFIFNYRIHGHDVFGYHVVNISLHIINAFLVYSILQILLSTVEGSASDLAKRKDEFSFWTVLIFLVHPIQTESVTYIWQRSELLSAFFYLSSYVLYLLGRTKQRRVFYVPAFILFVAGLFAKALVVTLPLMIIVTEIYFFPQERNMRFLKKYSPYLGVVFVLVVVFYKEFIIGLRLILTPLKLSHMLGFFPHIRYDYLFTEFTVMMKYIQLSFFPVVQNADYYWPLYSSFFHAKIIVSFLVLVCIFVLALKLFRRHRLASFGILWFFIILIPTSTIVELHPIWEHRIYLSLAGFAVIFVSLIFYIIPRQAVQRVLLIIAVGIFSVLTIARNVVWATPISLLEDTLKKSPRNGRPYFVLGVMYHQQGHFDKALGLYQKAIALNPKNIDAYNNLATIYMQRGEIEKAERVFEKTIEIRKEYYLFYTLPYINMAYIEMGRGDLKKAREHLSIVKGHRLLDRAALAFARLAMKERDLFEAIRKLKEAMKINPENAQVYFELGNIYAWQGQTASAVDMYRKSITLNPRYSDAYINLGILYFEMKQWEDCIKTLEQVERIGPSKSKVYQILADAHGILGQHDMADQYDKKARIPSAVHKRFQFLH